MSAEREMPDPGAKSKTPRPRVPLERNLFLLFGGEGLAKALAIIAFPYIARQIGKEAYGDLEFAIAVFFVLNLVMEAGLDPFGAREGAKKPSSINRLAGGIVFLRLLLLVFSLSAIVGIAAWIGWETRPGKLILAYGLVLLPGPLMLNWAFQARDRMHVVAASTSLRQLVFLAGALIFVSNPDDAVWVPAADAAGLLAVACFQNALFRRSGGRLGPRPHGAELTHLWRDGAALSGSTLAWATRVFAPTLVLWFATTSVETARYGSAHRLVVALHAFAWLYFMNLLPSLSRATQEPTRGSYRRLMSRSLLMVGWLILPGFAALTLLAPWLVPLVYSGEFGDAARPFQIAVWMPAIAFLSGHHRYGLIAGGHTVAEFRASLAGAIIGAGTAITLALTGRLNAEGAACAFVLGEGTTLLVARFAIASLVEPPPLFAHLVRPAVATAAGVALALILAPDTPIAATALVLGTAALLAPFLQRDLIRELRALLKAIRG